MRWQWGLGLLGVGLLLWLGSMVAHPYTSMGVGPQYVRPGVAAISVEVGLMALAVLLAAGLVVYWDAGNRRGWRGITFAVPLAFLAGTMVYRLIWIRYVVLG